MTFNSPFLPVIAALSATLAAASLTDHRTPEVLARPLSSIGRQINGWSASTDNVLLERIAAALDATSYLSRTYRKGGSELDVFMAFYSQQRAGESMHSPKYCLPGAGWEFKSFQRVMMPFEGKTVSINRAEIQKPGSRALLYYWYQSRYRVVASEYQSKFFLVSDGLLHGNPGGSIVRVIVPDDPKISGEAVTFAGALLGQVQKCFPAR